MNSNEITAYVQGLHAESRALKYLENKGFVCLGKRVRTPYGEIDLLMQDKDTLVAVEVKYRKDFDTASFAVQPRQQVRIQNALQWWIAKDTKFSQIIPLQRLDVVLVCSQNTIKHYENAWFADI